MFCTNHVDIDSEQHCITCFKPFCEQCLTDVGGVWVCSKRCEALHRSGLKRTAEEQAERRSKARKKLIKKVVALVVVVLCVSLGWAYLPDSQKEKITTSFDNIIDSIKNRGSATEEVDEVASENIEPGDAKEDPKKDLKKDEKKDPKKKNILERKVDEVKAKLDYIDKRVKKVEKAADSDD